MKNLAKYSMGIGDRFARQGKAQLAAMVEARNLGVSIAPVWNKSHREHTTIHTHPNSVRHEADSAVKAMGWGDDYHVDADHIGLDTVDLFVDSCDFFTLDVADFTGKSAAEDEIEAFVDKHRNYVGELAVPGIAEPLVISEADIEAISRKFLLAVREAGKIYRRIGDAKGAGGFITEVSMDETNDPQTPLDMLFILAAIADEGIPAQTVAPKFTGRFNKGVDYVGDVDRFSREFEEDISIITFAVREFGLPENLKLSVHSGSDKFSIYRGMGDAVRRHDAGLHIKTAGTTWLEELIGLAMGGGSGFEIAREVYSQALARFDELCSPYATVIDIDAANLPSVQEIDGWTGQEFASALRHDPSCPLYNSDLRQLLHVGYKVAAEIGDRYTDALNEFEPIVAANVKQNILDRHIKPIFIEDDSQ